MSESNLFRGSTLYEVYIHFHRAARHARVTRVLGHIANTGSTALEHSRLATVGRVTERWVRGSWLYRWLTNEPDPDVVVIDLRESWTVGPILAVLEWVFEPLERYWPRSGIGTVASRTIEQFRTAPIRLLGLVVATAVSVSLLLTFAFGNLSSRSLGIQLCVFAVGLLATRVDMSWSRLRDGPLGRALQAVLEPPDPPERP
jgi:hypothetical protein